MEWRRPTRKVLLPILLKPFLNECPRVIHHLSPKSAGLSEAEQRTRNRRRPRPRWKFSLHSSRPALDCASARWPMEPCSDFDRLIHIHIRHKEVSVRASVYTRANHALLSPEPTRRLVPATSDCEGPGVLAHPTRNPGWCAVDCVRV